MLVGDRPFDNLKRILIVAPNGDPVPAEFMRQASQSITNDHKPRHANHQNFLSELLLLNAARQIKSWSQQNHCQTILVNADRHCETGAGTYATAAVIH
jgi:hypothetical protein